MKTATSNTSALGLRREYGGKCSGTRKHLAGQKRSKKQGKKDERQREGLKREGSNTRSASEGFFANTKFISVTPKLNKGRVLFGSAESRVSKSHSTISRSLNQT